MTQRAVDGLFLYFVTTNTTFRGRFLVSNRAATTLGQTIIGACAIKRFNLLGFCILPDHFHLLVQKNSISPRGFRNPRGDGKNDFTLSDVMHSIKRNYSRQLNRGRFWQPRFNFRIIEDERRLANTVSYMQYNFQKHGCHSRYGRPPFVHFDWEILLAIIHG